MQGPFLETALVAQADVVLDCRDNFPTRHAVNARGLAVLGVAGTREFELIGVERWGASLAPDTPLAERDVLIYRATESGVRALWASPRFGLSPQDLYLVTIGADDTIEEAATLLHQHDVSRIPVVADTGLVGIVSRVDILRGMLRDDEQA